MYKTKYCRKLEKLYKPTPPSDAGNPGSYDYVFTSRGKTIGTYRCELFAKMREAFEVCANCTYYKKGICHKGELANTATKPSFGCNRWEAKDEDN